MGKKQIRISNAIQVQSRISEFVGKDINLVMADGNVFFGNLKSVIHGEIILVNMRLKSMKFALQKISEFYTDIDA